MSNVLVIPCSAKKTASDWSFKNKTLKFVADPSKVTGSHSNHLYCTPDSLIPEGNQTWRQKIEEYNKQASNSDKLCMAYQLYNNPIYLEAVERLDSNNVFILSAGWGIIRSDFYIPNYDITLSSKGRPETIRKEEHGFNDFNHLTNNVTVEDTIYFAGGKDYLTLFAKLTKDLACQKRVYYNLKTNLPTPDSRTTMVRYKTNQRTNWHYSCIKDYLRTFNIHD